MKKKLLLVLFLAALPFVSCDDDGPYEDYLVARPILEDAISFKAEAIDIAGPMPIESSGKIYAYGNYIFINDVGQGFHVINNQDPSSPQNIAFIKLLGNNDISIKDDKLFADSYGDLVIFDITDINNITLSTRMENAIYNSDGIWVADLEYPQADIYDYGDVDYNRDVIVGWEVKMERRPVSDYEDQFRCNNCEFFTIDDSANAMQPTVGRGGSMARFRIVGDYLYVVDYSDLNIFDISDLETPVALDDVSVSWDIETIFNQGEVLFIGGRQGMYIYDIKDPAKPEFISEFRHGTACDPVVVDGDFAYITLKGGNLCGGTESGLYIVDISNLKDPTLRVIYPMTGPNGLGIRGNQLFICDGSDGLKVFDKSKAPNITLINHFPNIESYDVIPLENTLLMVGNGTLRQYRYLENDIQLISTFELN